MEKTLSEVVEILGEEEALLRKYNEDPTIMAYKELLGKIEEHKKEKKQARDETFYDYVVDCRHLFFMDSDESGHVKTTCLECGLTSDAGDFVGLSDPYSGYMRQLIVDLFVHGEATNYDFVSGVFESLEEAKAYYQRMKKTNPSLPSEQIAERMLQFKRY